MQNFITQSLRKAVGIDKDKGVTPVSPAKTKQSDNSPLGHMNINNKWSYSTLEYPYDIQTRTDLGHYMLFYINVPNDTGYSDSQGRDRSKKSMYGRANKSGMYIYSVQPKPTDSAEKINSRISQSYSTPSADLKGTSEGWNRVVGGGSSPKQGTPKSQGTAAKELGQERTRRTSDAIVLYMPPQIGVNYTSSYKESEIGAIGGAMLQGLRGTGGVDSFKNMIKGGSSQATQDGNEDVTPGASLSAAADLYERKIIDTAGQLLKVGDALGTIDKLTNKAVNNFLEAMFTGIGFRKFSYTYRFTPRDEKEATMVDKIIRTFKFHMLPEYNRQTSGRYFTVPSEFDIFYMYRGDENTWMNKIYTCVCTGVDINYTPNQFQTLRPVPNRGGAPMSEIEMKLDFMETKLVTKEDILEGY